MKATASMRSRACSGRDGVHGRADVQTRGPRTCPSPLASSYSPNEATRLTIRPRRKCWLNLPKMPTACPSSTQLPFSQVCCSEFSQKGTWGKERAQQGHLKQLNSTEDSREQTVPKCLVTGNGSAPPGDAPGQTDGRGRGV